MTQVPNYIVEDGDGLTVLAAINEILSAVRDDNAGPTPPDDPVAFMRWRDTSLVPPVLKIRNAANTAWVGLPVEVGLSSADCRLDYISTSVIRLSRFNGTRLMIDGINEIIPSAGVDLSPSGLTPNTLYYIYAYMNAGTMTLEASTTVPATDATTGLRIKTGDATRTLVGMARPVTGPAWQDSDAQRFVRSWFNRRAMQIRNHFTTGRSTTSTSWVEVNSEIRAEFLLWSGEVFDAGLHASTVISSAGIRMGTALTIDGVAVNVAWSMETVLDDTGAHAVALRRVQADLSEGYHYATLAGIVSSGTGTWRDGVTAASRATITGVIHA